MFRSNEPDAGEYKKFTDYLSDFVSGIGNFLSSRPFKGLLFGLLLATAGSASQITVINPRIRLTEGDGFNPEDANDALQQMSVRDLIANPPSPFNPSQFSIQPIGNLLDDNESDEEDVDEYGSDSEQVTDNEIDEYEDRKEKRTEKVPRSDDLYYVPNVPASCSVGSGSFADVAASPTHDTHLVVRKNGASIYVQAYNTTDLTLIGNSVSFNGLNSRVVALSNGDYAVPYWVNQDTLRIKIFWPDGTEKSDVGIPFSYDATTEYLLSIDSYANGFFVEYSGSDVSVARLGQIIENNGTVGERIFIALDTLTQADHCTGAISVTENAGNTLVVDVYDKEQTSLRCKFIRVNDAYLSQEYLVPFGANVTAVADQSVAFGNSDEFVVVAEITESGAQTRPCAVFGYSSDFFSACTFSNRTEIPGITLGPHEAKYVGRDRNGRSIFDITGRDSSANLVEVRCWYDNNTDTAQFATPRVVTNIAAGSSTVITRLGEMLRAVWDVTGQVVLRKFTCSPVQCARTPADVQPWPSIVSSSVNSPTSPTTSIPPSSPPTTPSATVTPPTSPDSGSAGSATQTPSPTTNPPSGSPTSTDVSGSDSSKNPGSPTSASNAQLSVSSDPVGRSNITNTLIAAGAAVFGTLVATGAIVGIVLRRRRGSSPDIKLGDLELIGQGGYGTVFRKVLENDMPKYGLRKGDVIAIKQLPSGTEALSQILEEFRAEAERIQSCDHTNVIKCFWYSAGPRVYMALPLYEMGSLDRVMAQRGSEICWSILFNMMAGISRGLAYLHHVHDPAIIHRDVKPGNILVGNDWTPVITDFGSGRGDVDSHTKTLTQAVGTHVYMAPEVLDGKRYSNKADVYSFGILLRFMFTREQDPFPDYDHWKLVTAITAKENPARPTIPALPTLPEGDETIVTKQVKYVKGLMPRCWAAFHRDRPAMDQVEGEFEAEIQAAQAHDVTCS
jgi:hypothetical protein